MRSGPLNQRVPFATDREQLAAIDEWRRRQPDLPSRSEAIRRLLDLALQQADRQRAPAPEMNDRQHDDPLIPLGSDGSDPRRHAVVAS